MINDVTNSVSALLGHKANDNSNTSNTATPAAHNGGRIIKDTVDLSLDAKITMEERNQQRLKEQEELTDLIMSKGFLAWQNDVYQEKIEAEIRAEVLSSFGLDEDEFSRLESKVQQRIEEIIQEKARKKMRQEIEKELEEKTTTSGTSL